MMFRALELITLDLLCLYSNAMPQYLEQTIRNAQPVAPVRPKKVFRFIQQGPSDIFDHLDSIFKRILLLIVDAKLQGRSCHTLADTDLCPTTKDSCSTAHFVSLNSFLRPCVTARC